MIQSRKVRLDEETVSLTKTASLFFLRRPSQRKTNCHRGDEKRNEIFRFKLKVTVSAFLSRDCRGNASLNRVAIIPEKSERNSPSGRLETRWPKWRRHNKIKVPDKKKRKKKRKTDIPRRRTKKKAGGGNWIDLLKVDGRPTASSSSVK